MNNFIRNIQKNTLRPIIEEIEKNYYIQLKSESINDLTKNDNEILKEVAKKDIEELTDFILDKEGLELLDEGFSLVIEHLNQLPNQTTILKNLEECASRFISADELNSLEDSKNNNNSTLAEKLGIQKDTYDGFYRIGASFFNQREFDKALRVFILLTHLNPLPFEPWLGLGICWQKKEEPIKALTAFSMASIASPSHPGPYIHTAEVYIVIEQYHLAEQTLEFAKKMCKPDLFSKYQKHIDAVKKIIKQRGSLW